MPTARVNGVEINYEIHGSGAPLVLVHSFAGSIANWQYVIPTLAKSYRVIAFDQRGHGDSSKPDAEDAYRVSAFSTDILELLQYLDIADPVIMVGHSMGGKVTQHFCATYPERVQTAVFVATWAAPRPVMNAEGPFEDEQARVFREQGMKGYLDAYAHLWFAPGTNRDFVREHVVASYKVPTYAASHMLKGTITVDLRDQLAKITVPSLVIVGGSDQRIPVEDSEYINRHLPNAWLRIVPGTGHMPQFEDPEPFNRAILDFLGMVHRYPHHNRA